MARMHPGQRPPSDPGALGTGVEFRILGSLEAEADGVLLSLGGHRNEVVLAMLLLDAGRTVPVTRLADAVWDDDPPVTAAKQVRNAASRLRRLLEANGAPGAIVTVGAGYQLGVPDTDIDARVFEARITEAEHAASAKRPAEAADALRSALSLWRGPLLAGMTGRAVETAAVGWDERRRHAQEAYYEHMLALGRHLAIVADLSALAAEQPLREKTAGLLMMALYRCGRQADALHAYRDIRTALGRELGLDPGAELQGLHQEVLTRATTLDLPAHQAVRDRLTARERPAAAPVVPRQLPAATRYFTGRADELKQLNELLEQAAAHTVADDPASAASQRDAFPGTGTVLIAAIDGTAGIGKTALAVHWAHQAALRFPDGQLYSNLRGFEPRTEPAEPAEAVRGFLDALGVPADRIPGSMDAQAALYRSLLAGKRMLVVLDNARDAAHVRPLLPGAPGCLVLVASRNQLTSLVAAEGAQPLTLGLLTHAEARELLTRRLGPERLGSQPQAASELIELCARLPLALSIAAARAATHPARPLADLTGELRQARDRLDALNAGDAVTDLRAVFSWSYECLSDPAARMFRLLGLHPGPDTSLSAAASLAAVAPGRARAALSELTQAHLLAEHVPGRYTFHDLLRAYAAEQAQAHDGETDRRMAVHRVLDHYLQASNTAAMLVNPARDPIPLARSQPGITPEEFAAPPEAMTWFRTEHAVLLAAVTQAADSGFDVHAWQIPAMLVDFLDRQGHWLELAATQKVALAAAQRLGDRAGQAYAHHSLGRPCARVGRYEDARTHLGHAIDLYRQLDDGPGMARAHNGLAWTFDQQHRPDRALAHALQALGLYQAAGNRKGQAVSLNNIAWCHMQLGDYQRALECCRQALALHRESGDRFNMASTLDTLGGAYLHLGRHARAIACYRRAVIGYRDLGEPYNQADTLIHLGDAQHAASDRGAQRSWREALAILDDLQHPDADEVRAKLARLPPPPDRDNPPLRADTPWGTGRRFRGLPAGVGLCG